MRYQHVCLEALTYTLPDERVTSVQIEQQLAPLYERIGLAEGRLQLMTGIRERRFWPAGTQPSEMSAASGAMAIEQSGIDRKELGALVHGSVCRDYLEPATACAVHHQLGLPRPCTIYDVSNACLGILNGIVQVADMIELGWIRAGLVVGTESGRALVQRTIEVLNADTQLSRNELKKSFASLTVGSASAAAVLCRRESSRTGHRLVAATATANSQFHDLCRGGHFDAVIPGQGPLMETDSERLMQEGIATGADAYPVFLREAGWSADQVDKSICHQVGAMHRKAMLAALGIDPAIDYTTFETLGNTGTAAVPVTLAHAVQDGHVNQGDRVAMLGIGSGINTLMLALEW